MNYVNYSKNYVTAAIIDNHTFVSVIILLTNLKITIMGNLLYVVAVVLIVAWAVGFLGFHAGGLIHILLVIAIIAVLVRVIQGRRIL